VKPTLQEFDRSHRGDRVAVTHQSHQDSHRNDESGRGPEIEVCAQREGELSDSTRPTGGF
jgi:hypothetical protein